jgi:rRNA maturation endonuclease Nob1
MMDHFDQSLSYSQQQAREPSRRCEGCGWLFRAGRSTQVMCLSCGESFYQQNKPDRPFWNRDGHTEQGN